MPISIVLLVSNTGIFIGKFGFKIQIVLEVRLFFSTPVISFEVINLNLSSSYLSQSFNKSTLLLIDSIENCVTKVQGWCISIFNQ